MRSHIQPRRKISYMALTLTCLFLFASVHPASAQESQRDNLDAYIAGAFLFSTQDIERIVYRYKRIDYQTSTVRGISIEITDEETMNHFLVEMTHTNGMGVFESPSVGWKRAIYLYDSKGRRLSIKPSPFGITINDGPTQHFFHCSSDTFYTLADLLRGG